jgi:hypothetical protein
VENQNFINKGKETAMKFDLLTPKQLELLKDATKTGQELCEILKCGIITISRWRKKLGIETKRGCKKGKTKPWVLKRKDISCATCSMSFNVVISSTRKYCSKSCMFQNENYINSLRQIDRSYMQTDEYKNKFLKKETPAYRRYRNKVSKLTEQTYNMNKEKINPEGFKRTLAGVDGGYHLDHKISCRHGFDNNITPENISSIDNLQMLSWRENITKGSK